MKLIETINISSGVIQDGIFGKIRSIDSAKETPLFPWLTEYIAVTLDDIYYFEHSADKYISAYFKRMKKFEEDGIITNAITRIATAIIDKFSNKWISLYNAFIDTKYNPLENYNMKQKETPNVTRTKNVKSDVTVKNDVYGFNSTNKVPQSESNTSGESLNNEETDKETGTRDLERSGNIGVTTSQQMLQSEIDLRDGYNFYNDIMSDVDSMLCLLVY